MNDQMQSKLVEVIGDIQSAASKAGDFALSQLPDVAQSYVMYGRIKSAAIAVMLLLLATASFKLSHYAFKNPWRDNYNDRTDSNQCLMFFGALIGVGTVVLAFLTFDFLVWFAPKVWLLKELASLIR